MTETVEQGIVGRTVHYVADDGFYECAVIVAEIHLGHCNLTVYSRDGDPPTRFLKAVPYSADGKKGTWHWPEYSQESAGMPDPGFVLEQRLSSVETELQKHEKSFMQHQVAVAGLTQFLQVVSQAGDLEDVKEAAIDVLAVLNDVEE